MPYKINVVLIMLAIVGAVLADLSMNRRASMGFMGMRGKKDQESGGNSDDTSAGLELDKRSFSTLLFRRPMFNGGRSAAVAAAAAAANSAEGFKRAMGFVGMRGKKEYSKGSAGFFGMRGKKVPSEAFFGVRGKKWANMDTSDDEQTIIALHKIFNNMQTDGERNYVVTKFDEEKEIR
ncbi:tachykinins-like [Daktulosphaira vitifoliae]|uniref:tachykinins-like n=1 Tax=Daktulosphaira vitifoliae TaxID=58002 RepID=UPI0021AA3EEC|nr:tachykinins-like [Daktulosphaira vitifoliae]XP_050544672.1 tachykinins-like [Daktulosphaira vitifoliae]XP_050544673.1 tachykinins-like [Daktulosphaira vitifoliae]XP_050544674.1 tachykinins-like [Daktulosphaira vitifoliae]